MPLARTALGMLLLGASLTAHATCEPLDSCACSVRTTPINFGAYNALSSSPTDSAGSIEISCSVSTPTTALTYEVRLSAGGSGTFRPRMLTGPLGGRLSYNLYSDAARNQVWGDGTEETATVSGGFQLLLPSNNIAQHPVYARVNARQTTIESGDYADAIQVTVIY